MTILAAGGMLFMVVPALRMMFLGPKVVRKRLLGRASPVRLEHERGR